MCYFVVNLNVYRILTETLIVINKMLWCLVNPGESLFCFGCNETAFCVP